MATDSEAKKRWDKENTVFIGIKFQKKTDQDVIDFLADKNKRDTICAALREYMERHPDPKPEYRYGMRLRGYSPGAQPKGVLRREDDTSGKYYDIIVYDRQLSADEIRGYELEELK